MPVLHQVICIVCGREGPGVEFKVREGWGGVRLLLGEACVCKCVWFFTELANVNATTVSKYFELMKSMFSMTVLSGSSMQHLVSNKAEGEQTACQAWILTNPNSVSLWIVLSPDARVNSPLRWRKIPDRLWISNTSTWTKKILMCKYSIYSAKLAVKKSSYVSRKQRMVKY